ncbi:MAG: bifunctional aspartate kinase/homoserine dehydrogenase I [Bacteroidales bacterium]|nr:bifunctional aspartate kinase/homoserine dehydrogenase I [Bacteroidales bacterium]
MQVLKFGGTSVSDAANMTKVVNIVTKALENDRTILVLSAVSGCTDTLIRIGTLASEGDESYVELIDTLQKRHNGIIEEFLPRESRRQVTKECDEIFSHIRGIAQGVRLLGELSTVSLDAIQGCGELLSTRIVAARFASLGANSRWIDSRKIMKTTSSGGHNSIDRAATGRNISQMLASDPDTRLFIMQGFIASDEKGRMTTLGRGGSDYSASIVAVGCRARELQIWTDVPGMMTSNPKVVPTARTIGHISYRAALELSHFGAKVIYPPTIQPVVAEGIPIYVKNTFEPEAFGTLIEKEPPAVSESNLIGISNSDNIALISLEGSGMVGIPGFSSRLFETLYLHDINIILITQASSVHTMCIAISEADAEKAKKAADETFAYEISLGKLNPLKVEKGFSIVCLVGNDILNQSGTTGRMLAALGRKGIPVRATAQGSSERNISVIVSSDKVEKAIRCIHNEFFDKGSEVPVNLFLTGCGVVGGALLDLIAANADTIAERTGKRLLLAGLSNSSRFIIDEEGIDPSAARELLKNGKSASDDAWFTALKALSLENSIFVDCTASAHVASKYEQLFKAGYSVVACNKIAFSAPFPRYRAMKSAALRYGAGLRYETTVGAALPILETISRCVNSGDSVKRVEAVLSGSLNFLFSSYRGAEGPRFEEIVEQAGKAGYLEPDPSVDLSGRDVLRKILILSREAGFPLEESDVESAPLPDWHDEEAFRRLYDDAASKGCRLRYTACLEVAADGTCKASIGLRQVDETHPFYNLNGTDNCALVRTSFYPSPLVVQGAGAGGPQTASGLLNDILL